MRYFRSLWFKREEAQITTKARETLDLVGLADKASTLRVVFPYGEQRRVEIARALMLPPKLLLLDEPAAGMNPQETQTLLGTHSKLRDELKITVLLIEHDMKLVMNLCERVVRVGLRAPYRER